MPPGLDDLRGRVEVRLADAQADDVGHGRQDVEEAADARARNLVHAPGQDTGRERRALRFGFGVEDGRVGGESGGPGGRSHRCVLRLVRSGLRAGRRRFAVRPLDRAGRGRVVGQGQLGGLQGPPGCSGRDPFVRTGQTKHREFAPRRPDDLEADRKTVRKAGRDRDSRQAGHVDRQGAGVREVHRHRIRHLRAHRECDRGAGRRADRVEAGRPDRVEIRLDERPHLLRLQVVRVVVAGRKGVGAEHDPALDFGPEAAASRTQVVGDELAGAPVAEAVLDAVVAGQVGAALGGGDDVVGRQTVVRVRQRDFLDPGAGPLHGRDRLADAGRHAGLHAVDEVLLGQRDAATVEVARGFVVARGQAEQLGRDRHGRAGGVALVAAGDGVEQQGGVAGVAGERPDLVQAGGEGHDPEPADAAVCGLHADDAAQRGGLADAAAGVRADAQRRMKRGDDGGGTAGAAAGDARQIPGVGRRTVGRMLGRGAHRELVHVRLAQDHGSGGSQPGGDGRVERRDVALEDPRAGGRLTALDRDQVLERHRDAAQRMESVERRGAGAAGRGDAGVGGVGLGKGTGAIDREPGVEGTVLPLGDGQMGFGQRPRTDARRREAARPSHGRGGE